MTPDRTNLELYVPGEEPIRSRPGITVPLVLAVALVVGFVLAVVWVVR